MFKRPLLLAIVFLVALLALTPFSFAGETVRVSVDSEGIEGNADSHFPTTNSDGRFVAFGSSATNLVANDTNNFDDVFVYDRLTGQIERISVNSSGDQSNGGSNYAAISADGRYVAFYSEANNLVPNDTNGVPDIFIHDRLTGITERVSVKSDGNQANGGSGVLPDISADGNYVVFSSFASNLVPNDTNGFEDIFIHDRLTGITERVSVDVDGNNTDGNSGYAAVSANGRFVTFQSYASNLIAGDTNGSIDIFVRDRQKGTTEVVSVDSDGNLVSGWKSQHSPDISDDGRYIAFASNAALVPNDTNSTWDIFVHDMVYRTTTRASVDSSGNEANGGCGGPEFSSDGRYVVFHSGANNLAPGDSGVDKDIFVHDMETGTTEMVSVDSSGNEANGHNYDYPSISGDGKYVAFDSLASNLVPNDTNGVSDVFVHDRESDKDGDGYVAYEGGDCDDYDQLINPDAIENYDYGTVNNGIDENCNGMADDAFYYQTALVSVDSDGYQGNDHVAWQGYPPTVSSDGRYVAFVSTATDLVDVDTNGSAPDVFVHDRVTGETRLVSIDENGNQMTGSKHAIISDDGSRVVFRKCTNMFECPNQAYLYDMASDTSEYVATNVDSFSISADGRYVALESPMGGSDNAIYVYDSNTTSLTFQEFWGNNPYISNSVDGSYLSFQTTIAYIPEEDENGAGDIYLYDMGSRTFELISDQWTSHQISSMSADGRYVAYTDQSNLCIKDTGSGVLEKEALYGANVPDISADGSFVSAISNSYGPLYYDRINGTIETVRVYPDGTEGEGTAPSISADGRFVAFHSRDQLVPCPLYGPPYAPCDQNILGDVFVRDMMPDQDGDGYNIYEGGDCNDEDPFINPAVAEIPYNGIDENCNGLDDDTDFDLDGYTWDQDCSVYEFEYQDNNPAINPAAAEIPYNYIDENCNGMDDDDDLDGDSYGIADDCNDNDPAIKPDATEVPYNGIDENCNGMDDDDDLDLDGHPLAQDCNLGDNRDNDPTVFFDPPDIAHNGIDEDCDDLDNTITVTTAVYRINSDKLIVEATSDEGETATLYLDGYPNDPMTWRANPGVWEVTVKDVGGDPGQVTVCKNTNNCASKNTTPE